MSAMSVQFTYRDGRPFAAYICLAHAAGAETVRTEEVTSDLLIDYASDGTPLGIEIISPGIVTEQDINMVFDRPGLARPSPADLAAAQGSVAGGSTPPAA